MSRTKEADLVAAVYLYAARCWAEGDHPALRDMGFGRQELEDLLSVHLVDFQRLADLHGHPLRVLLDRGAFRLIVEHLRAERDKEDTMRKLLRSDAPLPMMEALYGMGGHEYTGWRHVLEVPRAVGRPAEPDEETVYRVWRALEHVLGGRKPEDVQPVELLSLHEETGAPLRALWMLVERWSSRGGPATREPGGDEDNVVPLRRADGRAEG